MDRTATREYPVDFDPLADVHVEVGPPPATLRVVPRLAPSACDVDLARAGSDPGIDEGETIGWL